MINLNYANAFQEVYKILEYINEEDYNKIPKSFLDLIEKYRNKDYEYEVNDEQDLKKQKMLPETKAILFNMYVDYLSPADEKEKITKYQKEALRKIEIQKQKRFNNDVFKDNKQ